MGKTDTVTTASAGLLALLHTQRALTLEDEDKAMQLKLTNLPSVTALLLPTSSWTPKQSLHESSIFPCLIQNGVFIPSLLLDLTHQLKKGFASFSICIYLLDIVRE